MICMGCTRTIFDFFGVRCARLGRRVLSVGLRVFLRSF